MEGAVHNIGANLTLLILRLLGGTSMWLLVFQQTPNMRWFCRVMSFAVWTQYNIAINQCLNDWVDGYLLRQLLWMVTGVQGST